MKSHPFYFVCVDEATRARLRREYEESVTMMGLREFVFEEYKRLMAKQYVYVDADCYEEMSADDLRDAWELFRTKAEVLCEDDNEI